MILFNVLGFGPVNYCWLLNHQVWKQRGEEYRIYGGSGWMWESHMPQSKSFKRKCLDKVNFLGKKRKLVQVADKIVAYRDAKLQKIHQDELKQKAKAQQTNIKSDVANTSSSSICIISKTTTTETSNSFTAVSAATSFSPCTTISSTTVPSGAVTMTTAATVAAATKDAPPLQATSSYTSVSLPYTSTVNSGALSTTASVGDVLTVNAATSSVVSDSLNMKKVNIPTTLANTPVSSIKNPLTSASNVVERLAVADGIGTVSAAYTNALTTFFPSSIVANKIVRATAGDSNLKTASSSVTSVVQSLPMTLCSATDSVSALVLKHQGIKNISNETTNNSLARNELTSIKNASSYSGTSTSSLVSFNSGTLESCEYSLTTKEEVKSNIVPSTFSLVSSDVVKPSETITTSADGSINFANFEKKEEMVARLSITKSLDTDLSLPKTWELQYSSAVPNTESSELQQPEPCHALTACVKEDKRSSECVSESLVRNTSLSALNKDQEIVRRGYVDQKASNSGKETINDSLLSPKTDDAIETVNEQGCLHDNLQNIVSHPKEHANLNNRSVSRKAESNYELDATEHCFGRGNLNSFKKHDLDAVIEPKLETLTSLSETLLEASGVEETYKFFSEKGEISKEPQKREDNTSLSTSTTTSIQTDSLNGNDKRDNSVISNDLHVESKVKFVKSEEKHDVIDLSVDSFQTNMEALEQSVESEKRNKATAVESSSVVCENILTEDMLSISENLSNKLHASSHSQDIASLESIASDFLQRKFSAEKTCEQKQPVPDCVQQIHEIKEVESGVKAKYEAYIEKENWNNQESKSNSFDEFRIPSNAAVGEEQIEIFRSKEISVNINPENKDFSKRNEAVDVSHVTPIHSRKDHSAEEPMEGNVLKQEVKNTTLPVVLKQHTLTHVNTETLTSVIKSVSENEESKALVDAVQFSSEVTKTAKNDEKIIPSVTLSSVSYSEQPVNVVSSTKQPLMVKQNVPHIPLVSADVTQQVSSVLTQSTTHPVTTVKINIVDSLTSGAKFENVIDHMANVSNTSNVKAGLQSVTSPSSLISTNCQPTVPVQTSSVTSLFTASSVNTLPTKVQAFSTATAAIVNTSVPMTTVSASVALPNDPIRSVLKVSASSAVKRPITSNTTQVSTVTTNSTGSVTPKLATIIQKPILPSAIAVHGTAGTTQQTLVNIMISSTASGITGGSVVQTFMLSTPQGMVQLQGFPVQASSLAQVAQTARSVTLQSAQQGQGGGTRPILPSLQVPNQISIPLMQGSNIVKLDAKTQGNQAVGSTAPVRSIAALVASISTAGLSSGQTQTIHFVAAPGGSLTLQGTAGGAAASIRPSTQAISGPLTPLSTQQARSPSVIAPKTVAVNTPKSSVTVFRSQQQPALVSRQSVKPVTAPAKQEEKFPMLRPVIRDPRKLIDCCVARWPRRHSVVNIFRLEQHLLKALARKAGMKEVKGFLYNTKGVGITWPASFPRPSFKVGWRYRTRSLKTLAGAGLQCRILHSCLKWEEMNVRPPRSNSTTLFTSTGRV